MTSVPLTSHTQLCGWATAKSQLGYHGVRTVAVRDGKPIAGAQLLVRSVRGLGAIGHVPGGPILPRNEIDLFDGLLAGICTTARAHRVRVLLVQPPRDGEHLEARLSDWGFRVSRMQMRPTATTVIRLDRDEDDLRARMRQRTRQNIRVAQRSGVRVRFGGEDDLPTFHRVMRAAARRNGYEPPPLRYLAELWQRFSPDHGAALLFSEYEGDPLTATMLVAAGDTVFSKYGGWSGLHGRVHSSEMADWESIRWAKDRGYRYFDFEGISRDAALAVDDRGRLPKQFQQTPTSYKLGFGGEAITLPRTHELVLSRLARWPYRGLTAAINRVEPLRRAVERARVRP